MMTRFDLSPFGIAVVMLLGCEQFKTPNTSTAQISDVASNKLGQQPPIEIERTTEDAKPFADEGQKWKPYLISELSPPRLDGQLFDAIRSGMKLGEMVELLGKGWMSPAESVGIITWECDDDRVLMVWPEAYAKDNKIFVVEGFLRPGTMRMFRRDSREKGILIPSVAED